ncbi:hypothetical protein BCR43DRAFT_519373 [Syncephalastrum racemosum]|uniref:Uncharacterized protein n=1 Tax=Syncephalastrum racemosum TaxID=13706 RepID=A0A1X2GYW8_SYNRA|nr:hypothetical protein BCR43DRAFT_519437 [Syncephalastrum racemosum]ORY89191.1 hypothetical protein BCR43DRAFT_519438 [Syncephalastrum racemosum]ORY89194.1 hypothetical protein BCR43DRAFT_519440 [Syncephalastrum racemosum]ORY89499.1 hypothetical protein BCR43DRAFT_519373 [Syncephalastrum racemosum]
MPFEILSLLGVPRQECHLCARSKAVASVCVLSKASFRSGRVTTNFNGCCSSFDANATIDKKLTVFLFHFIWLSFFGAYDLRPTVERDVTRGYTSWLFQAQGALLCFDITLAATLGIGQFSNGLIVEPNVNLLMPHLHTTCLEVRYN